MELEALTFSGIIYNSTTKKGASKMAETVIDFTEHFDGADELAQHCMLAHHDRMQVEAELLTRAGKATMQCDLSKRDKHGGR